MGQEFFINSSDLENKIRTLLPSQGGSGAGFDLSASTQIIPIVDLTESAEGSSLREDLQKSFSHNNTTTFSVNATTTTIITNTGYFRILATFAGTPDSGAGKEGNIELFDGATAKKVYSCRLGSSTNTSVVVDTIDLIVFCSAGDSVRITADNTIIMTGSFRQIASIDGTLSDPT
jgi:hypothetical protein